MSYEPTNWKTGDVVTSAKLNKLEEGVAASGMVVPVFTIGQDENYHCNVAFNELLELVKSGKVLGALVKPAEGEEDVAYMLESATSESIIFSAITVAPKSDDPTKIETLYYSVGVLNPDESADVASMSKSFN